MVEKVGYEYGTVFLSGGILYSLVEILWRGYTHWTMTLVGGICFLLLYWMNGHMKGSAFLVRCLVGAGVITAIEFLTGLVVNLILKMNVWDYSGMPFNLLGQVCLFFSCMWFLLCIPAFWMSGVIHHFFAEIQS